MKTRIIAAIVLVPLLLVVIFALPKVVAAVAVGVMAALAAYELLEGTGMLRHPRLTAYSMAMAFLTVIWCYGDMKYVWGLLGALVFTALLFMEMMQSHVKLRFEKVSICFAAGLLLPFLLASLVRIHGTRDGRLLIMIPFILSMLSDSGAYFVGKAIGSHKLAPVISPNKTIEGMLGGIATATVGMLIYTLILQFGFSFQVNYLYALIYGLVGSLAGVFGDLCFSVIKRQTGIKDYGNLIPGHGGILDRFDSMLIVGPLTEALLLLIPVAV
jgi:phosphatidate cytidylyltransferase